MITILELAKVEVRVVDVACGSDPLTLGFREPRVGDLPVLSDARRTGFSGLSSQWSKSFDRTTCIS